MARLKALVPELLESAADFQVVADVAVPVIELRRGRS